METGFNLKTKPKKAHIAIVVPIKGKIPIAPPIAKDNAIFSGLVPVFNSSSILPLALAKKEGLDPWFCNFVTENSIRDYSAWYRLPAPR